MADNSKEESLTYMDQCRVVCLGYISNYGALEIESAKLSDLDTIKSLCNVVDQEIAEFGAKEDMETLLNASKVLALLCQKSNRSEDEIKEVVEKLQNNLDEETFDELLSGIVEQPINSWIQVSLILHLVFRACDRMGTSKLGSVIDVSVRYMRKTTSDFVSDSGGWTSISKDMEDRGDGDISSSIVVIPEEKEQTGQEIEVSTDQAMGDANIKPAPEPEEIIQVEQKSQENSQSPKASSAPLSPLNTPPYSIPSSVTTDDDRESLATPPELVEKPQMTDSYLQAMGEVAEATIRRTSSTSGNGFEIINSDNGTSENSSSNLMTRSIDDVRARSPPAQERPEQQQTQDSAPTATPRHQEKKQTEQRDIFGGYLPHVSVGVAVAAAAIGFFALKKNM